MPVIPKPSGRGPLFHGKSMLVFLSHRDAHMLNAIRAARSRAARDRHHQLDNDEHGEDRPEGSDKIVD
jgi:hypothetical protein